MVQSLKSTGLCCEFVILKRRRIDGRKKVKIKVLYQHFQFGIFNFFFFFFIANKIIQRQILILHYG